MTVLSREDDRSMSEFWSRGVAREVTQPS